MITKAKILGLSKSEAGRNVASSYAALISTTVTGLISIPLAVHFLNPQELGLWSVIQLVSGYLSQLQLGLGPSTGRMMADSIIKRDKAEIDRWWTLTRIILTAVGLLIIIVGFAITPIFMSQLAADYPDRREALLLFLAMVVLQGIQMPFLGAEGILTAQNRFHLIPLRQCLIFWVEVIVIAACLFAGLKLWAMLWAQVSTLLIAWLSNWFMLSKSQPKLGWNFTGLDQTRIRKLFGFSMNISGLGFVQIFTRSIPVLLLGKFGGLELVPVYTLTNKVANVLVTIGMRVHQSFYPNLQRMFLSGDLNGFRRKAPKVGTLTVAAGLAVAGFILCFNRTAVGVLAKPEFYAGTVVTTWFSVAMITIPVSAFLQMPLLLAGKMGKSVAISVIQLIVGLCASLLAYHHFGLGGLAAVASLLPLVLGAYGYQRGATECGCVPWLLFGKVVLWSCASILTVILAGYSLAFFPHSSLSFPLLGKQIPFPGIAEISIGGGIIVLAAGLVFTSLRSLRSGQKLESVSIS